MTECNTVPQMGTLLVCADANHDEGAVFFMFLLYLYFLNFHNSSELIVTKDTIIFTAILEYCTTILLRSCEASQHITQRDISTAHTTHTAKFPNMMAMMRYTPSSLTIRRIVWTGLQSPQPTLSRFFASGKGGEDAIENDENDAIAVQDDLNLQEITMPEGLGGGRVAAWYKKEGDSVKYNDVYIDIETKDFAFGMSHDEEETVTMHTMVAQVDDKVEEGDLLCIVLRSDDDDDISTKGKKKSKK